MKFSTKFALKAVFQWTVVRAGAALALACAPVVAHAELWGYVDAAGVAHFATEQIDSRYELFSRGGEYFDTVSRSRKRPEVEETETPRPVAVPTAPPKLIAFF